MTGILETRNNKKYLFRTDGQHDHKVIAWDVQDSENPDRAQTHKWCKLPRKCLITVFDIENIPATVSYLPLLD